MAVLDFRDSGFGFMRARRRAAQDIDFDDHRFDEGADAGAADAQRFAASTADGDSLTTRLARVTHYFGALLSVALLVGLMVWGWQLVMRDVSGVPVIEAMAGDARIAPDDPGGELAGHTGLAVNEVSGGAALAPSDAVALAPETAALDDSDVAMGQLGATAREPVAESELPLNFDGTPQIALSDAEMRAQREAAEAAYQALAQAEADAKAATQAEAVAATEEVATEEPPVTTAVTDEAGQRSDDIAKALAEAQGTTAPVAKPVLKASARPAPRPRRVAAVAAPAPRKVETAAAAQAPAAKPAAKPVAKPDSKPARKPAAVATAKPVSGAQLAQIGAFDSNAIAESEWGRIAGRNGDLFAGKAPVIQKHVANGRTYWRLRVAGFDSRDEARRFCSALISKGTDCLAVAN